MAISYHLQNSYIFSITLQSGIWKLESGDILSNSNKIGYYSSTVQSLHQGQQIPNTGVITLILYFNRKQKGGAPHQMTCQGSHDLTTGMESGTVIHVTYAFHTKLGKPFKRVLNVLTIG